MAFEEIQTLNAEKAVRIGDTEADNDGKTETLGELTGYYLGYKSTPNRINPKGKPVRLHIFSVEGKNIGVWGATVMDSKLDGVAAPSNPAATSDGTALLVRVAYTGKLPKNPNKPGYQAPKNFSVQVDKTKSIFANVSLSSDLSSGEEDSDIDAGDFSEDTAEAPSTNISKAHAAATTNLLKRSK